MKYIFPLLILLCSCSSSTSTSQQILEETTGKKLNIEMFNTIFNGGDTIPMDTFCLKYKYKSIVFLENGCSPCYNKYITWNKEIGKLGYKSNYSILFIIKGKYLDEFLNEVDLIEPIEEKFYTVMDPNYYYFDGNPELPDWILETPILLDKDNKIIMIGDPFSGTEKMEIFKEIVSN